jgi:hypothetical protein
MSSRSHQLEFEAAHACRAREASDVLLGCPIQVVGHEATRVAGLTQKELSLPKSSELYS